MIFIYIFIGWGFWASLTNWKDINIELKFAGLINYRELFTVDATFHRSLINTIALAVMFVGITIPLGMLIAILLDLGAKGRNVFRTIYLLPLSFSFVVRPSGCECLPRTTGRLTRFFV